MPDDDSDSMMRSMMGFSSFGTQRPAGKSSSTSLASMKSVQLGGGRYSSVATLIFTFILSFRCSYWSLFPLCDTSPCSAEIASFFDTRRFLLQYHLPRDASPASKENADVIRRQKDK